MEAQEDAVETKRQLADVSAKLDLDDSQKQLSLNMFHKTHEEEPEWHSQIESVRKQHVIDLIALASALDEIQDLKLQLVKVTECIDALDMHNDIAQAELKSLKDKLAETRSLLEITKEELKTSSESDANAQNLVT